MNINLKISPVGKETGALLRGYLETMGLTINPRADATISYGVSCPDNQFTLNANVGGGDKVRRMRQMNAGGVRTVPWFEAGDEIPENFRFPAFARMVSGHGGTDIMPVFQPQEIPWREAAGFAWFSSYVPFKTEYRIWMFRGECLDVYEKVMQRPHEYVGVAGRNFKQGFEFKHRPTDIEGYLDLLEQGQKVLKAVRFDFAAIDALLGEDGKIYVLEANTAPGAIKSGAQATVHKLATKMAQWVKGGYPERGY